MELPSPLLSPNLKKFKKNPLGKSFLYFRKWNFLAPRLKHFSYFRKMKPPKTSYISGSNSKMKKNTHSEKTSYISYISGNGTF